MCIFLRHTCRTRIPRGCHLVGRWYPRLDFTCSPTVAVPDGAWVRVNNRRVCPARVSILSGSHKAPVRNRETWLEVTEACAIPEGFAGAVVRGSEVRWTL